MSRASRRTFVLSLLAGGSLATSGAFAQGTPKLEENDPQAVALGFKLDTTKVDAAKFPQHNAAQACGNCNFYQGKPTDPMAACQIFANKQVPAKGWCSAYSKKA